MRECGAWVRGAKNQVRNKEVMDGWMGYCRGKVLIVPMQGQSVELTCVWMWMWVLGGGCDCGGMVGCGMVGDGSRSSSTGRQVCLSAQ